MSAIRKKTASWWFTESVALILVSQAQLSSAHPPLESSGMKSCRTMLLWGFCYAVVLLHIYMWLKPIVLSALIYHMTNILLPVLFVSLFYTLNTWRNYLLISQGAMAFRSKKLSYRPLHVSIWHTKHMLFSLSVHLLLSFLRRFLPTPSPSASSLLLLQHSFCWKTCAQSYAQVLKYRGK